MKTKHQLYLIAFFAITSLLSGCKEPKKEDPQPSKKPLEVKTTFDSTNFTSNALTQTKVINQLILLTDEAKKARKEGVEIKSSDLKTLFNNGNPSLANVITDYYKQLLELAGGYFDEIAKASGKLYTPSNEITGEGGVYGTGSSAYLFDENGLEIEQMIEKGQFGAVLYKHLVDLSKEEITLAKVDQMLAIYGAHPIFANSGSSKIVFNQRDKGLANYAARRDKNDGLGLYSQIKNQFLKLQAAVKDGSEYNEEKNASIEEIKLLIEKVNFATVVNYCFAVKATMSKTEATTNEKAAALHAYGECVGFVHGWRNLQMGAKKIKDSEIDEILELLNASPGKIPTSYLFITSPFTELPKLDQIINKIKTLYGFSDSEIEGFKSNWVSIQGR
ncbi:MAG: hypothetical protein EAZ07_01175 [Cytophagales bacterium]|nr:MAG: hypothetical protein EAZ07_01175 [Cytophagales bacterium]